MPKRYYRAIETMELRHLRYFIAVGGGTEFLPRRPAVTRLAASP